ncbi:hypothetical protein [Sphingomonas sp. CFBP 13733]|uniref:hypothetical protein n=1 Tax=Sphingomonas sp. CFBP 13733 TaxID=2775291 RepID=UPI001A7E6DA2|nr:hypothetical protein [Sphingomonas sp. CFBP 13733]
MTAFVPMMIGMVIPYFLGGVVLGIITQRRFYWIVCCLGIVGVSYWLDHRPIEAGTAIVEAVIAYLGMICGARIYGHKSRQWSKSLQKMK